MSSQSTASACGPEVVPDRSRFHVPRELAEVHAKSERMVPGHILTGPVAVSSDGPGLAADLRVTQAANGSKGIHCNAPERLHEDITDDYNNMIYADTPQEIQKRRKNFLRKWRLRHPAVANSLEEAGGRLFIFTTLSPSHVVSTGALV